MRKIALRDRQQFANQVLGACAIAREDVRCGDAELSPPLITRCSSALWTVEIVETAVPFAPP